MWPFSKDETTTPSPPCAAAIGIARSLREEPGRWKVANRGGVSSYLMHDSGIFINTDLYQIEGPWLSEEPDANGDCLRDAIADWVAGRLAMPVPEPDEEEADDADDE